ncbi:hypothetical protein [Phytohabitans suffuscus]|uniref:hypothetical protein n=1 Tax=Phytohabitans suffuscus TaxID=624315 RepID=UPI0015639B0F|nr:hypothetical protein [Phytohabitans suffuscus]
MTNESTQESPIHGDRADHPAAAPAAPTAAGVPTAGGDRHERSALRIAMITAAATIAGSTVIAIATIVAAWLMSP